MVYLSSNNAKMHGFSPSSFLLEKTPFTPTPLHNPQSAPLLSPSARFVSIRLLSDSYSHLPVFYRDTNIPHTLSATFLPTAAFPASTPCLFVHGDALRSFCSPAENEYKAMP